MIYLSSRNPRDFCFTQGTPAFWPRLFFRQTTCRIKDQVCSRTNVIHEGLEGAEGKTSQTLMGWCGGRWFWFFRNVVKMLKSLFDQYDDIVWFAQLAGWDLSNSSRCMSLCPEPGNLLQTALTCTYWLVCFLSLNHIQTNHETGASTRHVWAFISKSWQSAAALKDVGKTWTFLVFVFWKRLVKVMRNTEEPRIVYSLCESFGIAEVPVQANVRRVVQIKFWRIWNPRLLACLVFHHHNVCYRTIWCTPYWNMQAQLKMPQIHLHISIYVHSQLLSPIFRLNMS